MTLGYNKMNFLNTPTPIQRLDNISADLGINLFLKRDDLTNFGTGGNKLRKLDYLVKDAKNKGATMLLTVGGAQTNHGRLTGAIATKYGMKAAIVAVDPYPGEMSANLLLDGIMGCPVYLVQEDGVHNEDQLFAIGIKKVREEWEAKGEKIYSIPLGGSNELGILGYYDCAMELATQVEALELNDVTIISTVGSMGTYMGLQVGIKNERLPLHVTGIAIEPKEYGFANLAAEYYGRVKAFYNLSLDIPKEDFDIITDYHCGAYNNPVKEVREAMYYMGRKEGIILDPCYTGKTFAGMVNMIKTGRIKQDANVIFLHTGGVPGIYTKHHRIELEKELESYIHII